MFGNVFFIAHGTLVSHAGEGSVNVFDYRAWIMAILQLASIFSYSKHYRESGVQVVSLLLPQIGNILLL
jgi:hypothetical protein